MAERGSNPNTPNDTEKKSPLGKMLSRSGSIFGISPKPTSRTSLQSPADSERRSISPMSRSYSNLRSNSVGDSSVETAFDSTLPYSRAQYNALLSNDLTTVEELKTYLRRTMQAVDTVKDKCVDIEDLYKVSLSKATNQFQSSVSELFVMEQKMHSDESIEGLQAKLKHMKERMVKIDKERRAVLAKLEEAEALRQRQEMELKELREVTGGSMDEIRMWAVDAKMTRALLGELATEKSKVESLERELNHDKNHFAEMSAVFDEKSKDFKSRMETLEAQHSEMSKELTKAEREVAVNFEEMTSYKTALSRTNDRMRQLLETTVTKMEFDEEMQRRKVAEMKVESEMTIRKNLEKQLEATHHKFVHHIEELQAEVETANVTAVTAQEKRAEYEGRCTALEEEKARLDGEVESLTNQVEVMTEERQTSIAGYIEKIERLEGSAASMKSEHDAEVQKLSLNVTQMEALTDRQLEDITSLHNQIDELKGNIRVFARIRPLLQEEVSAGQAAPAVVPLSGGYSLRLGRSGTNEAMLDTLRPDDADNTRSFSYDKVFPPDISQKVVFEQVSEYVKATMEGHATCLLSYGQTGSGKTYSMQGPTVDPTDEARGIIPRAMEEIVRQMEEGKGQGWTYTVNVSFIQIYLETVQDLLRDTDEDTKHEIKKSGSNVVVTDVNMVTLDPSDTSQITKIMEKAARMRSVAATGQNAESSRSHAIFTLHIHGENAEANQVLDGSMYLVDLAGSERLSKSQASGETLKETQFINKSLSALGDVFLAIANKSSHVPYRNSKLTYLLQSALSGFHKTLMIVHLSPTEDSYGESLCTMRFASQVNSSSATSSLRSMSLGGGEQGQSRSPSFTNPAPSSRSPSFTLKNPPGIAAKSPRNSLTAAGARNRSDSFSFPPSPPGTPKSNRPSLKGSPMCDYVNSDRGTPDTLSEAGSLSKKVRGVAKVFSFDFADDLSVGDAPSPSTDVCAAPDLSSPGEKRPPLSPKMSSPASFSSATDDQKSAEKKTTATTPVTASPITKRSGYVSTVAKRSTSGDIKLSPGKPAARKVPLPRSGSSMESNKSSRPPTRPAVPLPPASPKASPTKRVPVKPKSTF